MVRGPRARSLTRARPLDSLRVGFTRVRAEICGDFAHCSCSARRVGISLGFSNMHPARSVVAPGDGSVGVFDNGQQAAPRVRDGRRGVARSGARWAVTRVLCRGQLPPMASTQALR